MPLETEQVGSQVTWTRGARPEVTVRESMELELY